MLPTQFVQSKKLNIRGLPQNISRYGHPHCFDFLVAASGRKHKPDCKNMRNVMQHASSKLGFCLLSEYIEKVWKVKLNLGGQWTRIWFDGLGQGLFSSPGSQPRPRLPSSPSGLSLYTGSQGMTNALFDTLTFRRWLSSRRPTSSVSRLLISQLEAALPGVRVSVVSTEADWTELEEELLQQIERWNSILFYSWLI